MRILSRKNKLKNEIDSRGDRTKNLNQKNIYDDLEQLYIADFFDKKILIWEVFH